jgi:hypothetical protein
MVFLGKGKMNGHLGGRKLGGHPVVSLGKGKTKLPSNFHPKEIIKLNYFFILTKKIKHFSLPF